MNAGNQYGAMVPIATQTLSSAATTVTFSSISESYTDLVIILSVQSTSAANTDSRPWLRFNNDSAANYSTTYLLGNGTSASSTRDSNRVQVDNVTPISTTPEFTPVTFNVFNYSNATTYKTALQRAGQQNNNTGVGGSGSFMGTAVSLWRSTAAINRVDVICGVNGQFATNSTFTLYGIRAVSS
jgi:hypothetical protein